MILLPNEHYHNLREFLSHINFNHLFAKAVIDQTVGGRVYVDEVSRPQTFYVVHNYGMSLLGGKCDHLKFNAAFKEYALNTEQKRAHHEWMQVFPHEWNTTLKHLLGGALIKAEDNQQHLTKGEVELNTRVNFVFDKSRYFAVTQELINNNPEIKIVESTSNVFDEMKGSVVPSFFFIFSGSGQVGIRN